MNECPLLDVETGFLSPTMRRANESVLLEKVGALGICGTALDILVNPMERQMCEQLLHFSRATT